jgi:hypothetical protein
MGSARRKACTYTRQHTQIKRTQTSVSLVGFEPKSPIFEPAKTVQVLDHCDRPLLALLLLWPVMYCGKVYLYLT